MRDKRQEIRREELGNKKHDRVGRKEEKREWDRRQETGCGAETRCGITGNEGT